MDSRHPGLTRAIAAAYTEAAIVCLSRHHEPPKELSINRNQEESKASVDWRPPDERTLNAWANASDATRDGAYAMAIAAVELSDGLVAVRRAETLAGADYYLGRAQQDDFEATLRLEVSGTDGGDIGQRLREKQAQARAGRSNLPAIAAVVGFKELQIATAAVVDS